MKTVKIHAIQARADRLNQPDVFLKYKENADEWEPEKDRCVLQDHIHTYLNSLWDEKRKNNTLRTKPIKESCVPCGKKKSDKLENEWENVRREIAVSAWNEWKAELDRHIDWFNSRTWKQCELDARKKRFIERFEDFKISLKN
jgi:hypothetical protein